MFFKWVFLVYMWNGQVVNVEHMSVFASRCESVAEQLDGTELPGIREGDNEKARRVLIRAYCVE